jgi:hypothetical protein
MILWKNQNVKSVGRINKRTKKNGFCIKDIYGHREK